MRFASLHAMSALDLPQELTGRAWSVAGGTRYTLSHQRLASKDLHRPFWGVRSAQPPSSLQELAAAYFARPRPGQHLSGSFAAMVWGLPIPERMRPSVGEPLELCVAQGHHRPSSRGVRARRLREDLLIGEVREGLPVLSPAATLLTLAHALSETERMTVAEAIVTASTSYPGLTGPRPLTSLEDLTAYAYLARQATGGRALRHIVPMIREGVESPAETQLRLLLIEAGLPEPSIQHQVFHSSGKLVAILDLAYERERVGLEYEGDHHRVDRVQWQRDIDRTRQLEALGWTIIRVTARDMTTTASRLIGAVRLALSKHPGTKESPGPS